MCRVQSLFNSLGDEVKGKTIGLGGDGRYYNKEAAQIILKLAAGAGVKKVGDPPPPPLPTQDTSSGWTWLAAMDCRKLG